MSKDGHFDPASLIARRGEHERSQGREQQQSQVEWRLIGHCGIQRYHGRGSASRSIPLLTIAPERAANALVGGKPAAEQRHGRQGRPVGLDKTRAFTNARDLDVIDAVILRSCAGAARRCAPSATRPAFWPVTLESLE